MTFLKCCAITSTNYQRSMVTVYDSQPTGMINASEKNYSHKCLN